MYSLSLFVLLLVFVNKDIDAGDFTLCRSKRNFVSRFEYREKFELIQKIVQ